MTFSCFNICVGPLGRERVHRGGRTTRESQECSDINSRGDRRTHDQKANCTPTYLPSSWIQVVHSNQGESLPFAIEAITISPSPPFSYIEFQSKSIWTCHFIMSGAFTWDEWKRNQAKTKSWYYLFHHRVALRHCGLFCGGNMIEFRLCAQLPQKR